MTGEPGAARKITSSMLISLSQADFKTIAEYIGYATVIAMAVASIAGIFWYVFRQKDDQQAEQAVTTWRELAESQQAKIRYLQTELNEMRAEVADLELRLDHAQREAEDLRKANLRLQGILEH